jgi:DNA primase catalytic subunit
MNTFKKVMEQLSDDPVVTREQLKWLERELDKVFNKVGLDVEFTKHFLDRVNDPRNKKQITVSELSAIFTKTLNRFGDVLSKSKSGLEAVMRDIKTSIHIPFVLHWNASKGEMEIISKTVMRKRDFKSSTKVYSVK